MGLLRLAGVRERRGAAGRERLGRRAGQGGVRAQDRGTTGRRRRRAGRVAIAAQRRRFSDFNDWARAASTHPNGYDQRAKPITMWPRTSVSRTRCRCCCAEYSFTRRSIFTWASFPRAPDPPPAKLFRSRNSAGVGPHHTARSPQALPGNLRPRPPAGRLMARPRRRQGPVRDHRPRRSPRLRAGAGLAPRCASEGCAI